MTRRHGVPVEVVRRDDEPSQFLWRSRLYVVRAVLCRWVTAGRWWESSGVRSLTAAGAAGRLAADSSLDLVPIPPSPRWGQRAWGEPAPDLGVDNGLLGLDDDEEEMWRVEAAAGRSHPVGVYDLGMHVTTGRWTLHQVVD